MKNYTMIELENDNKYIIVDMLEYDNKKYFLLAQVLNEVDIDNEFNIYILNEEKNNFYELEDELEYNYIKDIFEKRLENIRQELLKMENVNSSNIIKLKLLNISDNDYTFEGEKGKTLVMNIELFDDFKLKINDYIYILEDTAKENITVRFGPIITDETEIIKIVREEEVYYLQRYYG